MSNNNIKIMQNNDDFHEQIELKQNKNTNEEKNEYSNNAKDEKSLELNLNNINININHDSKEKNTNHASNGVFVEKQDISEPKKCKKLKSEQTFTLIDTLIDDVGITWYHFRIYLILSLFFLADGAEMIVISLLIKQMGEIWNLSASEKGFTGSAVFIGFFIGALVAGKISDVHGRKPVFVAGSILVCTFSIASAFANNFTTFLILRALNGFGIGISIPSSSSLAAEITPTQYRSWVLNLVWIFFPFGEVLTTVIAKYILKRENGWRYLLGFAALPTVLSAVICFFIYESPRFYFTIRNYDKAFLGLERMIKNRNDTILDNHSNNFNFNIKQNENVKEDNVNKNNNNYSQNQVNYDNKSSIDKNQVSSGEKNYNEENEGQKNPYKDNINKYLTFNNIINEEGRKIIKMENERDEEIKPEFKTLLKKKYLFLTILCCLIFYVCSFVYYGLIYILPQTIIYVDPDEISNKTSKNYSVNFNSSNSSTFQNATNQTLQKLIEEENEDEMYKGVILSALSEIPATFLTGYIGNIPFLGRKGSMLYGFILSGISSILCSIFMKNLTIFATALKFAINIPFGVIYLYVSEAFPTKIRTISLGVTNSFNRLGGISTPIISELAFSSQANNPYKIYALTCFLAAIFSYILPFETLGRTIN